MEAGSTVVEELQTPQNVTEDGHGQVPQGVTV